MNITATTTDDQINAPVAAARQRVFDLLQQNTTANDLAAAVNEVARAEGAAQAHARFRNALAHDRTPAEAVAAVTGLLLNGADDAWSGRSNDVRRARFDGLREAVQFMTYQI